MLSFLKLHYYLTGGRGAYLLMLWGLPLLIASLAYLTFSLADEAQYGNICGIWLIVITGGQGLLILAVAPGTLRKAIERDFVTGMIDSHRIMPRSNYALALSYITTPPVQLFALFALLFPAGVAFAYAIDDFFQLGTTVLMGWLFVQLNLISTCIMLCALVTSMTLAGEGKSNILGLIMFGLIGSFFLMFLIPGLSMISGFLNMSLISSLLTSRTIKLDPTQAFTALASQLGFTIIFFLAAARRVRVSIWPMYSVGLGLMLVLLLATVMAISFNGAGLGGMSGPFDDVRQMLQFQLVSSIGLFAMAALIPLSSAINEARVTLRTQKRVKAAFLHTPLMIVFLVSVIGCLVPMGYWMTLLSHDTLSEIAPGLLSNLNGGLLLATIVMMVTSDYAVLAIGMRLRLSPWFVAIFILLILRLAPVMAEAMLHELSVEQVIPKASLPPEGLLASLSPLGLILSLLNGEGHYWTGLIAQALLLIVMVTMARLMGPPSPLPRREPAPRLLREASTSTADA